MLHHDHRCIVDLPLFAQNTALLRAGLHMMIVSAGSTRTTSLAASSLSSCLHGRPRYQFDDGRYYCTIVIDSLVRPSLYTSRSSSSSYRTEEAGVRLPVHPREQCRGALERAAKAPFRSVGLLAGAAAAVQRCG